MTAWPLPRCARDSIPILVSLYDLALARQAQSDLVGAAGHLKEGLALATEVGDESSAAYYLEVLAAVAGQQDNPGALRAFAALVRASTRLRRCLRQRSRVLVNGIAGAGQHHLGSAQPHGRVVHVMSHRLAARLDGLHAELQVPMYVQRIAHPILLVSRGSAMLRQLSALLAGVCFPRRSARA